MRKLPAFLLIISLNLFGGKTDSLKALLSRSLPDTQRCSLLNRTGMSFYFSEGQLDSALNYLEQAKVLAAKSGSKKHLVSSLLNFALVIREKGSFEKAMEDYFHALKIAEQLNDQKMIGSAYSGIAVVYSFQKDQEKAREYFNKALKIAEEQKDEKRFGSLYNNIGLTYMDDKNFPLALKYMLLALDYQKRYKNDNGTAAAAENIGLIYDNLGNYKLAMQYYDIAYKIWTSRNDAYSTAINMSYMAMTFNHVKEYLRARDTGMKALRIATEVGALTTQADLHTYLSETFSGLKDFQKALYHYKKERELRDSLKSEKNIKAYTETQLKYTFYKQQLQDSLKYVMNVNKKEEQLKAEKNIRYIALSALGVFAVLLFFLLKSYREKKEANKIILHQKNLVEEKQKEVIDSITYARRIQTTLLASDKLLKKNLNDHFVFYRPKDIVAGDFYWATEINPEVSGSPNKFCLVVGDCTGHGVPGAFMSLLNTSILRETISEKKIVRPDLILNAVRRDIISSLNPEGSTEESKDGMDGVVVVYDRTTGILQYAGANNSFYIVRNGELITCRPDKMPVGKSHDNESPFTLNEIQLKEKDMVYLFSDGFADQFGGPKGKKFKYRQLADLFLEISGQTAAAQKQILEKTFDTWKASLQQVDDVCVVGFRI